MASREITEIITELESKESKLVANSLADIAVSISITLSSSDSVLRVITKVHGPLLGPLGPGC